MRKVPKQQRPNDRRQAERPAGLERKTSRFDTLEPPDRTLGRWEQNGSGSLERPGAEYGARRPERQTYKPYDLDAFDRSRSARAQSYDLDAFSSGRQRPAQPSGRPVSQQSRPAPRRAPQRAGNVPPAGRRIEPPGPPERQQRMRRGTSGGSSAEARRGATPGYRNREEQRRAQNQRRLKRLKRRRALTAVSLTLVLLVTAAILCCTVFFKIDTIQIKGTDLYSDAQFLQMLDFKAGDNMLLVNRSKQEQALANNLPYVKKAKLSLSLPSTMVITIEEAQAKYYVPAEDGTYTYLDDTLKVLESGAETIPEVEGAVSLEGTAFKALTVGRTAVFENETIQKALQALIAEIASVKLPKVTAIMAVNEATNFVVYDDRITIKIGTANDLEEKFLLAKTSLEDNKNGISLAESSEKGTLDVTIEKHAYFTQKVE